MVSDVLFESIEKIEEYLKSDMYKDSPEIVALIILMQSIQDDLDAPPYYQRNLSVKTFTKDCKAVGFFILYMARKLWGNIFRKKNITYFHSKRE